MATNLDYGASVPLNLKAPFTVNADPNKPPGDRFKDYIPKNQVTTKPDAEVRKKNFMKPPVSRYEGDYISGDQSASRREKEKLAITELAKQLYADEKNKREAYATAEKTLAMENPDSKEKERAEKIVSRMKPMSKEEAVEKATKQFYGVKS